MAIWWCHWKQSATIVSEQFSTCRICNMADRMSDSLVHSCFNL